MHKHTKINKNHTTLKNIADSACINPKEVIVNNIQYTELVYRKFDKIYEKVKIWFLWDLYMPDKISSDSDSSQNCHVGFLTGKL